MKINNLFFLPLIALSLLPQIASSGFLDELKKSINISSPNTKQCRASANYYRKLQVGLLSPNSGIYRGPDISCGISARTSNGGNVQLLGELTDWYYIAVQNSKGGYTKGWTPKNRVALPASSVSNNNVKQIEEHAPDQQVTQADTPNKQPQQRYPREMVADVQKLLNEQGYDAGSIDGLYGKGTREAVTSFQRNSGLKETGLLDLDTLSRLNNTQTHSLTSNNSHTTDLSTGTTSVNINKDRKLNIPMEDIHKESSNDSITYKVTQCYPRSSVTQVYIDDSVDYLNHTVAKDLLVKGAKYAQHNCPKYQGDRFNVYIFRKKDLTQKGAKSVVSATVSPADNYALKQYINADGWKRDEEKRTAIVTEGDVSFENMKCHNYFRQNITNIYIKNDNDLTDHNNAKSLLNRGIKHGKNVCGYKYRVEARIYPKSLKDNNSRDYANNALAYLIYEDEKVLKYYNKVAEEKESRIAENNRRENLIRIIKKGGVQSTLQANKLVANPFIYEDQIVLMNVLFTSMLSKDEALFAQKSGFFGQLIDPFLVTEVPTTRFSNEKRLLLIGRVIGRENITLPTGSKLSLPHVEFIDAYVENYQSKDLEWALNQLDIK